MNRHRSEDVFVLRTWLEGAGDPRTMRGRVDHVASGRSRYFGNFGDLCDFISAHWHDPEPLCLPVNDEDDSF